LKDYGAEFSHIDITQPAIGIPQLHTAWRSRTDPGGFVLEFREGAFDYVEHQIREIVGHGVSVSEDMLAWEIQGVAHLDLVVLTQCTGSVDLPASARHCLCEFTASVIKVERAGARRVAWPLVPEG
jgi:hypothetical protein